MSQNSYNLRELLDLSLRVPEVGAVNFNIMYFLLKAILQVEGLENFVPSFVLEEPFAGLVSDEEPSSGSALDELFEKPKKPQTEVVFAGDKKKQAKSGKGEKIEHKPGKPEGKKLTASLLSSESLMSGSEVQDEVSEAEKDEDGEEGKPKKQTGKEEFSESKVLSDVSNLKRTVKSVKKRVENLSAREKEVDSKLEELESNFGQLARLSSILAPEEEEESDEEEKSTEEFPGLDFEEKESQTELFVDEDAQRDPQDVSEDPVATASGKKRLVSKQKKESKKTEVKDSQEVPEEESIEEVKIKTTPKKKDAAASPVLASLASEINKIKKHLKMDGKPKRKGTPESEKGSPTAGKPSDPEATRSFEDEDSADALDSGALKANLSKMERELLRLSNEQRKLKEKCVSLDKVFHLELSAFAERNVTLEKTVTKVNEEIDGMKVNWEEMVHNTESLREQVQSVDKQMNLLIEIPGLSKRVEQLEEYVYDADRDRDSEDSDDEDRPEKFANTARPGKQVGARETMKAAEKYVTQTQKVTKAIALPQKTESVDFFQPSEENLEKRTVTDIKKIMELRERQIERKSEALSKFRTTATVIKALFERSPARRTATDVGDDLFRDEDLYYGEPQYEKAAPKRLAADIFDQGGKPPTPAEVTTEYSDFKVKMSAFTSPDILEEHSKQLKGQVIVYVKKRLEDFQKEMEHMELDMISIRKKNDFLETNLKELFEKLTFAEANYSQRASDLIGVKHMVEKHEASIQTIVQHLDRKAEIYVVNQKVSRKELTLIEDRFLRLCESTSSALIKFEEKLEDFSSTQSAKLSEKLSTEAFRIHYDALKHGFKVLENRIKEAVAQSSETEIKEIQYRPMPVEIKKFVITKDGTKVQQAGKKSFSWSPLDVDERVIPVTEFQTRHEVLPRIQRQLEMADRRESTRYAEGAYTKIKVGKK